MDRQVRQARVASRVVVIRVNLARVVHRRGRVGRAVVTPHQAVPRRLLNGAMLLLTVRIRMIVSHTIPPSLPSQHTLSHRMIVLIHTPSHRIAIQVIVKTHTPSRHTLSHRILSRRIPSRRILRIPTIPRMQGGGNRNGDRPRALRHGLREVASLARAVEDQARHGRAVARLERYEGI